MDSHSRTPKVSLGLPIYNAEKYLDGCLRNILGQTFRDFELIISDNCSTDGTQAICQAAAAADPRVRYLRADANNGASWNFNRVLELARSDYFKWVAYDDLLSPDYLERAVHSLDTHPEIILAYGNTVIIDATGKEVENRPDGIAIVGRKPSQRLREYLFKVGYTNAIYGVMRTATLRRTSGLEAYPGSDVVLLGELAVLGRFDEILPITFYRRIHPAASAPSNPSLNQLAAWWKPSHATNLILPKWQHLRGYSAAIRRSPWGALDKLRCFFVLLAWNRFMLPELGREAVLAARYKMSRGTPA